MTSNLVLSVFPGVDLMGRAFEEVWGDEICVVRGPDVLWGGDIKTFHAPAGVFAGVIGGPPCQCFSRLSHMVAQRWGPEKVAANLIPEFERVVAEAQPHWFLMENVPDAPLPVVSGYGVSAIMLNNRWLGEVQNRVRRFCLGVRGEARSLNIDDDLVVFERIEWQPAVLASGGNASAGIKKDRGGRDRPKKHRMGNLGYKTRINLVDGIRLQGLPPDFLEHAPFTVAGKLKVVGNGVPIPMGRAIARAVKKAMEVTS